MFLVTSFVVPDDKLIDTMSISFQWLDNDSLRGIKKSKLSYTRNSYQNSKMKIVFCTSVNRNIDQSLSVIQLFLIYNLLYISLTYPKTIAKEIFLDVRLYKMTEPQDKSIFYAHRFQQKAMFE